jgi:hypothetical protein
MPDSPAFNGKDSLIAFPLLGSALALTYDVGYFTGTDINFFSMFSISEHVTFALETIPLALPAASLAFILPLAMLHGNASARSRPFEYALYWVLLGLLLVFMAWWQWYWPTVLKAVILAAFVLTAVLTLFLPTYFARPLVLIPFAAFAVLCCAFGFGIDVAEAYRNADEFPYTVTPTQGADLKAKVVRSGERGLLFYEQITKRLVLLPWSEIKRVDSSFGELFRF